MPMWLLLHFGLPRLAKLGSMENIRPQLWAFFDVRSGDARAGSTTVRLLLDYLFYHYWFSYTHVGSQPRQTGL